MKKILLFLVLFSGMVFGQVASLKDTVSILGTKTNLRAKLALADSNKRPGGYASYNKLVTEYTTSAGVNTLLGGKLDTVYATLTLRTNWSLGYTDRLKWDGGATGLNAATGRTSLSVYSIHDADSLLALKAPLASPSFSGLVKIGTTLNDSIKYSMFLTMSGLLPISSLI